MEEEDDKAFSIFMIFIFSTPSQEFSLYDHQPSMRGIDYHTHTHIAKKVGLYDHLYPELIPQTKTHHRILGDAYKQEKGGDFSSILDAPITPRSQVSRTVVPNHHCNTQCPVISC